VGPATLQRQRHGLLGAGSGKATWPAQLASRVARHHAILIPVMNHSFGHWGS
jgi:hypothetical protein